MKRLLLFASIFVVCSTIDRSYINMMVQIPTMNEECLVETSATEEDVNSFFTGKVPASHEGKCWLFCMHKRLHIQHEDGTFDDNGIINFFRPLKQYNQLYFDYILRLFSTCAEKAGIDDDPCIYSSNFFNCCMEN